MNAKQNAGRLAREGFRVLPIAKGAKRPALATWEHLKTPGGFQSVETVDAYQWQDARDDVVGIVTGLPTSSGSAVVVAVDLDKVQDPGVLAEALQVLGLPSDYSGAETTPNGFHIWAYVSGSVNVERFKVSGGRFEGVEVRGLGGQTIVYPPFLDSFSTGSIHVVSKDALRALVRLFVPEKNERASVPIPQGDGFDRIAKYLSGQVPPGERHTETLGVASIFRELGNTHEQTYGIMLRGFNKMAPGYTRREFETDVRWAFEKYERTSSVLAANNRTPSLLRLDARELMKEEVPPLAFLVEDLILDRGLYILGGEPGAGKSVLALTLALDVAGGVREQFLGWKIAKRGGVILVDIENDRHQIVRRLKLLDRNPGDRLSIVIPSPDRSPTSEEIEKDVREEVERRGDVALVIVDGLYLSHRGDENSQADIKTLLAPLLTFARAKGIVVLLLAHVRKGGKALKSDLEMLSGTGVFGRIADGSFLLRRSSKSGEERLRIFRVVKVRGHSDKVTSTAYGLAYDDAKDSPELFFRGPVDEDEHLQRVPGLSDGKKEKKSDLDLEGLILARFPQGATWGELVAATRDFCSESTLRKLIREAVERKALEKQSGRFVTVAMMFRDR